MKPSTANYILTKVLGWTGAPEFPKSRKAVILGVPHTSIWDFVISFLYARANDAPMHIMVKDSLFFWPLGSLLRKWGAIPIKRDSASAGLNVILQTVEAFRTYDNIIIGIAPEGTRKPVKKWKSGYHAIATRAGVPVYAGFINWKTKYVSFGDEFPLTDDAKADTLRLQRYYKTLDVGAKYPKDCAYDDEV